MPTSGMVVLLILLILKGCWVGSQVDLAASDDSSFCLLWGKFCFSWVLHSKSFSVVFIPLVESKFGVDACSWDKIPG